MLFGAVGLGVIYEPLLVAQGRYVAIQHGLVEVEPATETPSKLGSALEEKPAWEVPDAQYSVYIPKIGAKANVITNVNAASETEYQEALKRGVAEAANLSHPGEMGTTYLFSHSVGSPVSFARYNAVFYLLDKLEIGDRVEVMYRGKLYKYQVNQREILKPDDVKYLRPQFTEEQVVLQTCYPPGTTWNRLYVVGQRI